MNPQNNLPAREIAEPNYDELVDRVGYDFGLKRRSFVQLLGAGLLIAASAPALAQRRGGGRGFGGSGAKNIESRIHLGKDGSITVLVGKVEAGQGARAELTQAAAEELKVPSESLQLIMADTGLVPDDGITAGSGSTPRTVPSVRQGAAAARELLIAFAAKSLQVDPKEIRVENGLASFASIKQHISYADLAKNQDAAKDFQQAVPAEVQLTPVKEWKVMGASKPRPNGRDVVTGVHKYPSDISRPGMLYGKILRAPAYGSQLTDIDLGPAKALPGVVVVRDDQFVGVAAPNRLRAEQALSLLEKHAKWEPAPHPSSKELFTYLREHAEGGVPANPYADHVSKAKHAVKADYHVAYVQHSPLEPRAAVAEWVDGKLTVWAGT